MSTFKNINLRDLTEKKKINARLIDRSDCFYWQTDRDIDPKIAGEIFVNRHAQISDEALMAILQKDLNQIHLEKVDTLIIKKQNSDSQNLLGNVNIVRDIFLGEKEYILRMHPKGLNNGYFFCEKLASEAAKQIGVPAYKTIFIKKYEGKDDFAYMLIEKLPGISIKKYLQTQPNSLKSITILMGEMMGRLHQVSVENFGFFDNDLAQKGKFTGIHYDFKNHLLAGLYFNLEIMRKGGFLDLLEISKIDKYFHTSPIPHIKEGKLIHNDFADWNLLTDGNQITGVVDWDESLSGDPVADLACWTTFFDMDRFEVFLDGYKKTAVLPNDFEERLWFYRLRYLISKLTLRYRRLTWDFGPFRPILESKCKSGRSDLLEAMKILGLG